MICFRRKNKRGQVWYTDFIVAVLIFVICIVIYFEYMTNVSAREISVLEELVDDAKSISSSLVSEGNPPEWNSTNVIRIGITDGNMRINQTKLDNFYNLSYDISHRIFKTRFNYHIYFENSTGSRLNITDGDSIGIEPVNQKDIVQMTRLLIYESGIIRLKVEVWR